jgi:hypothetical protein
MPVHAYHPPAGLKGFPFVIVLPRTWGFTSTITGIIVHESPMLQCSKEKFPHIPDIDSSLLCVLLEVNEADRTYHEDIP